MSFDPSAENLWQEYREAEELRDDHLGVEYEDKISRFVGPGYRKNWKRSEVDFENHSYEWISLFLPLLASGNPRVKSRSRRMGVPQLISKAIGLAVNRNFHLTNFKRTVEKLAVDWAFKWSCSVTSPEPAPGLAEAEDPPYRPVTKRLSPTRFFWDIAAIEMEDLRFQGHMVLRDKKDLLDAPKAEGWNWSVISSLETDKRQYEHRRKKDFNIKRDEVELLEFWIPELMLDSFTDANGKKFKPKREDGFNGTIYTIARSAGIGGEKPPGDYARRPRPFWGPREGPYTFSGYLTVPDEVVPLSPIGAVEAQSEELNAMRASVSANMEAYKRGVAIDSMAGQDVAEKIKEFDDLHVFIMDNVDRLKDHVEQIELGGITPTHLTQLQLLRESLDRASGMTEAQRGQVTGAGTATEASLASQASGQRMGFMTEKFLVAQIQPIAEKEAWYLSMDPRSKVRLGEAGRGLFSDPETGTPVEEVTFIGGSDNLELMEELDIEIEPISTRYTSEALEQERAAKVDALVLQVLPLIPQMPYFDWASWLERKGEEIGDPSLASMVDIQTAMELGQLMMGAQLSGGFSGEQKPQQRLGIDVGTHLKAAETSQGFSANARPQPNKGPRQPGGGQQTSETHGQLSKVNSPGG